MKKSPSAVIISVFMIICLLVNAWQIPVSLTADAITDASGAETADGVNGGTQSIIYSADNGVGFNDPAPVYEENCKSEKLLVSRAGEVSAPYSVTVKVYDNSAEYGQDYIIRYKDAEIEKIEGSTAIYSAFRDNGVLSSNLPVDAAEIYVTYSDTVAESTSGEISASDMLSQIEEIGALVAEFKIDFASGEAVIPLDIELFDDQASEYDESFVMVLVGTDGNVIENSQILCTIEDNEEDPTVHVEFNCDSTLDSSEATGIAQVEFKRSGNLAVGTSAVLLQNETPIGYVNFAPYQETQVVLALPGTYRLMSDGAYSVGEETIVVKGTASETQALPEGADPVLDAVPNEYAAVPQIIQGTPSVDKFAEWARNGEAETDDYIIVMGSAEEELFLKDSSSTDGSHTFHSSKNMYQLNTEGGAKQGYLFLRSKAKYNLSGIESVEGTVYVQDLSTGYCDVIFGIWNKGHRKIYTNDNDSTQNLKFDVAPNLGSQYIYYCNSDLKGAWNCGWNAYVPNGFKMNKREYNIFIMNPVALDYSGTSFAPSISNNKISGITMGADRDINISYTCDSAHPARLTGYQLFNGKTMSYSSIISLSDSHITFDQSFLSKYDASWGYDVTDENGNTVRTISILPVFEKIEVDYSIKKSALGTLTLESPATPCKGDTLVFSGEGSDGFPFAGVFYQCRASEGSEVLDHGVALKLGKTATLRLDQNYGHYTFQGVFNADADKLSINYADETNRHGRLLCGEGVVLDGADYRLSDYYPLTAAADEGYVTVWISSQNYYFGDIFNYQLDGNYINHDLSVKFVKENDYIDPNDSSTKITLNAGKISGQLTRNDWNLFDNSKTDIPLSNTMYTVVTSHGTYTGFTDENGYYTIDNFTGVLGGTYSMSVNYQERVGYITFEYNGAGDDYNLVLPQFAVGGFYPTEVTATVSGQGYNSNTINLTTAGDVEISAKIYVHSEEYTVTGVKFHFLSTLNSNFGDELKTMDATLNESANAGDKYQIWQLNLSETSAVPENTRLYITVTAEYTYESGTTVESTTDLVNSGYDIELAIDEDVVPIQQDIPEIPGVQSGGTDTSLLDIPVIGTLDMSFSSKTGGYFIQQGSWKEAGDTYTLICGHSIQPNYMTGTLNQKYEMAKGTRDLLDAASSGDPKGKAALKQKTAAQIEIAPVFMLKFTLKTEDDGKGGLEHKLVGFEFAIGLDAFVCKNVPFSLSGVPCYVCVTVASEAYFQMQLELPEDAKLGSSLDNVILEAANSSGTTEGSPDINAFIAAPIIQFGLKGGVGWNGWASIFAEGTITAPFIIGFTPLDAAGIIAFDIGIGADMMMFTAEIEYNSNPYDFGSKELLADLKTIQGLQNTVSASYSLSSGESYSTFEEAINNATFSVMERPAATENILRSGSISNATLAEGVFKNTKIHLIKLGNGNIMALFLTDNHAEDGSFNYLSAAYCISDDNGESWSEVEYVSENVGRSVSSLQYDINVFELQDRILVTWSEADLDTLLKDIDAENLTAAQIAKLVNAMNLKGRFFDNESGEPIGEAFTVAENSAVFCGALDAVQNGENVYVYYQRNALPTAEDVTFETLMRTERTIAMASANINDTEAWTSVSIRATVEDVGQYRITEVVPFVHDGVFGEIIVIDTNGKLLTYDYETEEFIPDIEDRQLYLRTYSFDENGVPQANALLPITNPSDCAQSPRVVSNDNYLYLFWNQNGEVVYAPDFVAKDSDSESIKSSAFVVASSDGTQETKIPSDFGATSIDGDESFHIGSTFTVSMSDEGSVFVCWVAADNRDTSLIPTDEVYGIMLQTKPVSEVLSEHKNASTDDIDPNEYQLWAVGSPIALTDEDRPIGAVSGLCLESGDESKFLLAYTRLNNILRNESTAADILTQTSTEKPELSVDIEFPEYPVPGDTAIADVTVSNEGFRTLDGCVITLSGIGEDITYTLEESVLPGRSAEIRLEVVIPGDFDESTALNVSVAGLNEQSVYTAENEIEVLYDSYFVPTDIPEVYAIPNSNNAVVRVCVRNVGNANGAPSLDYLNRIFASDSEQDAKSYVLESDTVITPSGEAVITYVMKDTFIGDERYSTVVVRLGEGYDQSTEAPMPEALKVDIEDLLYDSGSDNENGGDGSDESEPDGDIPEPGDSRSNTVYALVMISAVTLGFAAASSRKRKIKK